MQNLQTDLVEVTFHYGAGAQNLRLRAGGLNVLQVLLSDLKYIFFKTTTVNRVQQEHQMVFFSFTRAKEVKNKYKT